MYILSWKGCKFRHPEPPGAIFSLLIFLHGDLHSDCFLTSCVCYYSLLTNCISPHSCASIVSTFKIFIYLFFKTHSPYLTAECNLFTSVLICASHGIYHTLLCGVVIFEHFLLPRLDYRFQLFECSWKV